LRSPKRHKWLYVLLGPMVDAEVDVAIVRLLWGNRVTVPKDLVDELGWKVGDKIRVRRKERQVFLERVELPKRQRS